MSGGPKIDLRTVLDPTKESAVLTVADTTQPASYRLGCDAQRFDLVGIIMPVFFNYLTGEQAKRLRGDGPELTGLKDVLPGHQIIFERNPRTKELSPFAYFSEGGRGIHSLPPWSLPRIPDELFMATHRRVDFAAPFPKAREIAP